MQVIKEAALEGANANLELFQSAATTAREENVGNVQGNVEALVDHMMTGTPLPVVEIKAVPQERIEPLQAFISKLSVLAPDENGNVAISDSEYETFVRAQTSSITSATAKLVLR